MRIKHIHSSGRYDGSPLALHNAIHAYINAGAHLITLTETEYDKRKAVLNDFPGYGHVTGHVNNRDDCSQIYDKDVLELVYEEQFKLSDISFDMGGHQTPPSYACIAVYEFVKTGKRIVVGVYHTPSAVQGEVAHKTKRLPRTRAWYVNNLSLRRRMNQLRRHHKAQAEIISNDWNIDFFFAFARATIKAMFPAWRLTWLKDMPSSGTHGKRLIDGTLLKGAIKCIAIRLFKDDNSSDHRPYEEILEV